MKPTCTTCGQRAVEHHCPDTNTDCCWLRCTACGVIVDWRTKRGVARDGTPVTL